MAKRKVNIKVMQKPMVEIPLIKKNEAVLIVKQASPVKVVRPAVAAQRALADRLSAPRRPQSAQNKNKFVNPDALKMRNRNINNDKINEIKEKIAEIQKKKVALQANIDSCKNRQSDAMKAYIERMRKAKQSQH